MNRRPTQNVVTLSVRLPIAAVQQSRVQKLYRVWLDYIGEPHSEAAYRVFVRGVVARGLNGVRLELKQKGARRGRAA
ncbi:MAG: hypothetical protein ACOY0T_30055 [Myxococcota bacterium]